MGKTWISSVPRVITSLGSFGRGMIIGLMDSHYGTRSTLRIPETLHNRMEGLTSVMGVRTPTGQDQGRTGGRYYHR